MTQRQALPDASLKQLFTDARTVNGFQHVPVSEATLHALYDLLKWGPTAFNAQHWPKPPHFATAACKAPI